MTTPGTKGSSGSVSLATASPKASPRGCPAAGFTRAVHLTTEVSWPDTLGLMGGTGKLEIWNAVRFKQTASGFTTETRPCGADIPAQTTSAVAGGYIVHGQVPYAAFDSANMPKAVGTATKHGSKLMVNAVTTVIGMRMDNPNGPWPSSSQASQVASIDADDDGKPGITAVPKQGPGFGLVPTNIFQNEHADELYNAQRTTISMSADEDGCPDAIQGQAVVATFDTLVIGCRVQGRGNCTPAEVQFLNDSRPQLQLGRTTWTARLAPDKASCSDVRALTP